VAVLHLATAEAHARPWAAIVGPMTRTQNQSHVFQAAMRPRSNNEPYWLKDSRHGTPSLKYSWR